MKDNDLATDGSTSPEFRPSRGRPTKARIATIESSILTAARAVFLEQGFSGTSMDNVAQLAQVSRSTLYGRYPDKSKLFEAVAKDRLQAWWRGVPRDVLPADIPISERLLRRGLTMIRLLRLPEVGAFGLLVATEMARFPEIARLFRYEGYEALITLIAEDLKAAAPLANLTVTDPYGVARIYVAALQGWHIAAHPEIPVSDDDCVAYVSRVVSILLAGKASW